MTTFRLILRNRLAAFGGLVLLLVLVVVLMVPLLPLADPDVTAPANRLKLPFTEGAPLGTDHLGRDLLSRLVWGTRLSLAVGIAAAVLAAVIGSTIGIVAGFYGGRTDNLIMRGVDMLMAFPYILLALAIVAALGPGLLNALYAVAVVNIPFFARNIRGVTVSLAHREFVDAARLSGMGRLRIIWSEILPNVLPVIVIAMSTTIGWMILETAGLSFLGLGSQPPQADLGSMLGEGRKLLINAPHASIVPGLMIFVIVMSVNLLGDGVRDALDPRLRSGALSRPAAATSVERSDIPVARETPALLDVDALHTEFQVADRVHQAVGGVSFEVAPGECLGIVGESGSGKSVTALSLLGLVASPPGVITGGAVRLGGADTLSMGAEALRQVRGGRVAYIFQDPLATLHPLYRTGDQIVEAIRAHRPVSRQEAWAHAVSLLEKVRIPNAAARAKAFPHELSGGMRQRVGIALALANDPDLVIADEPTTALDVTVQAQILALLDDLRRERDLALVFITHDFGVVAQLCDRVAVMYGGRIVETGPTTDVLADPWHPYTRRLIACVPELGGGRRVLEAIPGLPPAVDRLRLRAALRQGHRALRTWRHRPRVARRPRRPLPLSGRGGVVTTALDVRQLGKTFGGGRTILGRRKPTIDAVRDATFSVGRGETLGIVGESGCGKSTLARMLVGLLAPTDGRIEIEGKDLSDQTGDPAAFGRLIQYVFQDPISSLNPRKSIRQILEAPLIHLLGMDAAARKTRIGELFDAVNLRLEFLDRYPHEFSGGQAQRIGIARALAASPRILVLDEPVSALDVSVQAQVLNLLAELRRAFDLTYLFISHDLAVVEAVSDRVAVLYFGRIVEIGRAEAIFGAPRHPYTDLLARSAPVVARPLGRTEAATAELPDPLQPPPGCAFAARCPRATDVCRDAAPPMATLAPDHDAACYHPLG